MITRPGDARLSEPPAYEELPPEALAEEVEAISPEGRPADAALGPRRIGLLFAGVFAAILAAAVLVAVFVDRTAGIAIGVLLPVMFLLNPVVGGAVLRARERERAKRRLTGEPEAPRQEGRQ